MGEVLTNETKAQKQFRLAMERKGYEVMLYSGRGMYGAQTYAVACSDSYNSDRPTVQEVTRATRVPLRRDALGLDVVLYV